MMRLLTMLLSLVRDFMLKFWLKNLDYKIVIHLILIVACLNLTHILKVTKLFWGKKIKMNLFSND